MGKEGKKGASFPVETYWDELSNGSVKTLRGANTDYHRDGLKYVVEVSLKPYEAWRSSERRNCDLRRLFRSLCIFEKQQFLAESPLKLFYG